MLILHLVLAWLGQEPGLVTAQDDGRYMSLARSILQGGYRDLYLVGEPWHSVYPPGYPLFLAAWSLLFGTGFSAAVASSILLSTAALWVSYQLIRERWSALPALLVLLIASVNPVLLARAGSVRSEPLYMLLSMTALLWAARGSPAGRPLNRAWLLAAGFAIAAGLTRSIGLSVVGAVGLGLLLQRRWRATVVYGVVAAATVGAWLAWTWLAPQQAVGVSYFADALYTGDQTVAPALLERAVSLVQGYVVGMPWALRLPSIEGTIIDNLVISAVLWTGLLAGLLRLRGRAPVLTAYLLAYAAILLVWPYALGRFLEPIMPLLIFLLLYGWAGIGRAVSQRIATGPRLGPAALLGVGAIAILGSVPASIDHIAIMRGCRPFSVAEPPACMEPNRRNYLRSIAWVGEQTPEDAVFLTAKPEALFIHADRQSLFWYGTFVREPEDFVPGLLERGADYVLLGSAHHWEPERILPGLQAACDQLEPVAEFPPRTFVFRLHDRSVSAGGCEALDRYDRATIRVGFERPAWDRTGTEGERE